MIFSINFIPAGFLSFAVAISSVLLPIPGQAALVMQAGKNFTAATYGNSTSGSAALPPDAALAVGTNHLVMMINGRYSVFSKSTVARLQTMTDRSFWVNAGVTLPTGVAVSDPRVVYDLGSQRFFASIIDVPSAEVSNRFLIAVSATSDPTGAWRGVAFPADPVNGYFADFGTFGIDAEGVYISGDMFDEVNGPIGPSLVSIPKADLLANPPSVDGRTSFGQLSYDSYGEILQPAVSLGGASSSQVVLAMGDLGYDFQSHTTLKAASIQNAASNGAAILSSPVTISVPAYSIPLNPPQPGGSDNIDDGDARIGALVYRSGDIVYAVHGTQVSNRAAIQWFQINANTLALMGTGIISDPVLHLFYPAIAVNSAGAVVIVFNGCSTNSFVSGYAMLGEPLNGSISFGNRVLLKAGVGTYRSNETISRWGDYSAVAVDPVDSTHFWALTMYPSSSTGWTMQITELIARPLSLSISSSAVNLQLSWPGSAASYQLQSAPASSSPTWSPVSQTPVLSNDQYSVSLPVTPNPQFFRLSK